MRLGTDIIEIERIKDGMERQDQFYQKVLAPGEIALFETMPPTRAYEFLAGRFSAKEAYAKAIGSGIGRLKFTDIEILPDQTGVPTIVAGPVIEGAVVSISHCRSYATATVIIDLPEVVIKHQLNAFFIDEQ